MMLIGGIIAGYLLPWLLVAPAIPLLLLLIKRTFDGKATMVLTMLCVSSILSHIFLMIASGSGMETKFQQASFLAEILLSGLLLKFCTDHALLRYGILTTILVFSSVYITHISLLPLANISNLMLAGILLIFMASVLVLISKTGQLDQNILEAPAFWFAGGIFFHFGLLGLLFITAKNPTDIENRDSSEFWILYLIIFFVRFILFSVGVSVQKPWENRNRKS